MFRILKSKLDDYMFEKRMARQRYKNKFADCDCWGMSYWFCETFPKMIIRLRDMKHGAPELPFEEFDKFPKEWKEECIELYKSKCNDQEYTYEPDTIFEKWFVTLSRIAYCLEQANEDLDLPNPYKEEMFKEFFCDCGECAKPNTKLKNKYYKYEEKNWKYKMKMKDEAFKLLSKYFYNLWD